MFRQALVIFSLAAAATVCNARSGAFPPGWNKLASTPPLGWRSWNAFGNRVSQDIMEQTIAAITAKKWTIEGKANRSLADAGYATVGIDEGWEGCGQGVNGSQHDASGNPVINSKFSDMAGLVKTAHAANLKIGWYENGCACGERHELTLNYKGDVRQLHALGFDGVKLDGCGAQRNMTLYADLMRQTGKSYLIENCHWGRCTPGDNSSCPTQDWCPFNWYRTSGDIDSSQMSWYRNLQTTIPFQDSTAPLSRPGCWAYPDMLEVGKIHGADGVVDFGWNRAHFGAWCVVSAPLILGLDITEDRQGSNLTLVIDVITNSEAIAVNQAWAGHPGALVWSSSYPAGATSTSESQELQAWAKPLTDGVALLLINPDTAPHEFAVPLSVLPLSGMPGAQVNLTSVAASSGLGVRDIWARADAAPLAKGAAVVDLTVGALDSAFVKLHAME